MGVVKTKKKPAEPHLTARDIERGVLKRLAKYKKLNLLEQFALFMGMAQVLEGSLKRLLANRYDYDFDQMERWTLGRVANELERSGLRGDYIFFLESVVKHRNYIAHEFLANEMMLTALLGTNTGRLEIRNLEKGIYELEQLMFLHDWTDRHDAWD